MKPNTETLFTTLVGSRLYGLEGPGSDYDYRGVKLTPLAELLLAKNTKNEQVKDEENDTTWYEGNHFLRLLIGGNPTMLEVVYSLRLHNPAFLRRYPLEELLDSQKALRSLQGYIKGTLAKPTHKGLAAGVLYIALYHHLFNPERKMEFWIRFAQRVRRGECLNMASRYLNRFLDHEDEYCREADLDVAADILKLWYT